MSLDWSLKGVKDQTPCWEVATADDTHRGREKGEKYMTALTETMIHLTMAVDLGRITEKNFEEFHRRVEWYERQNGTVMSKRNEDGQWVPRPITLEDVKAHIGLATNVTNTSVTAFARKMKKRMERRNGVQ